MVTAAMVLLAGALLLAGSLRDDGYLVTIALGLSLAAVLVESVQVLRGRRTAPAASAIQPPSVVEPAPSVVEPVGTTTPSVVEPAPLVVEPVETTPVETPDEPDPQPVRLPGRATYHRPDCPTVRGKEAVPVVAGIAPSGQTLAPCRRCRPPAPEEWAPWGSNPQPAD